MTASPASLALNRAWLEGYIQALRYATSFGHCWTLPSGRCGLTLDEATDELAALGPAGADRPRRIA